MARLILGRFLTVLRRWKHDPPWSVKQHDPPRASSRVPRARAEDVPALLSSRHTLRCVFHAEWCAPPEMSSQGVAVPTLGAVALTHPSSLRFRPCAVWVASLGRDANVPVDHGQENIRFNRRPELVFSARARHGVHGKQGHLDHGQRRDDGNDGHGVRERRDPTSRGGMPGLPRGYPPVLGRALYIFSGDKCT